MKIRNYASSIGFEVVGRIRYLGKYNTWNRAYMDEAKNLYLIDIFGDVEVRPSRKERNDTLDEGSNPEVTR